MKTISSALVGAITTVTLAALFAGCSPKHASSLRFSPAEASVTPDSSRTVHINSTLQIPSGTVSSRSRLIVEPQLVSGDSVIAVYDPIVLDGPIFRKKNHRELTLGRRRGANDPYASHAAPLDNPGRYHEVGLNRNIRLPRGVDHGRFVAVVSSDGCGSCSAIDTLEIAQISNVAELIEFTPDNLQTAWLQPEFEIKPKIHHGAGEAHLNFRIDRWDIDPDMANNRVELNQMLRTLQPIAKDSLATLTSLVIEGMASPDGGFKHNSELAAKRAASARDWLAESMRLPRGTRRIIRIGSRAEGWDVVVDAMNRAGDADSVLVKRLMAKYPGPNDDAAEPHIRKLPIWPKIAEKYLAKDRRVVYNYSWTVRSFTTDDEMLRLYGARPDAFNEQELLRVAELTEDPEELRQVYRTILQYYPRSEAAANNLAVLDLRAGNVEEARKLLEGYADPTPCLANTLAVVRAVGVEPYDAASLFERTDSPEARYNLGLAYARQHRYDEAYDLLRAYEDLNTAILDLCLNRNESAWRTVSNLDDSSPRAMYVTALAASRMGYTDSMFDALAKACTDPRLRRLALDEPDFGAWRLDKRFIQAVGSK